MKKTLYRIMTGIMLMGWMLLIFQFSNQPAEESSEVSGSVCYRIVKGMNETFEWEKSETSILSLAEQIEYPVRKAAHMTEYAILGLLSFTFYRGFVRQEKRKYLLALVTAAIYAGTDEFHQLFVAGRSAEIRDVCIDTLGAAIGLGILFFILKLQRKHCEKRKLHLQ